MTSCPHPGLPSLGQNLRDYVSVCGWELPERTSALPGRGGERSQGHDSAPSAEVSEHP